MSALRRIPKGTRVIEYRGERISNDEVDRMHEETNQGPFTLLFEVDKSTIIDVGIDGNSARYINHSYSPNREAANDGGHIFIEALRDIGPGEELSYDYRLETEEPMPPLLQAVFGCNCGAAAAGAPCSMSIRPHAPAPSLPLSIGDVSRLPKWRWDWQPSDVLFHGKRAAPPRISAGRQAGGRPI